MQNADPITFSEIEGLPNSFFAENRQRFIENIKLRLSPQPQSAVLFLQGGDEISRYDQDTTFTTFLQESNFYYLTGVREPGFQAAIDLNTGKATLFCEKFPEDNKIWMKVYSKEDYQTKYEIDTYYKEDLNEVMQFKNPDVIYLLEGRNEYSGLSVFTADLDFKIESLNKKISHTETIYEVLCDTRSVKSKTEEDLMRFIGKITNEAHEEVMQHVRMSSTERDLEVVFLNKLAQDYNTRIWAYPCIGGCGVNSATLHYEDNTANLKDGDLFLADMGIRFCNYTSDVTRTFPVNGKFTEKQKEIYNVVLQAQKAVFDIIKPGICKYRDMDTTSKKSILSGLKNLGFFKKDFSVDELFNAGIHSLFMPHGLGHLMGLDVHDVGSKVSYKSERILEPGNVITNEPGVYFIRFVLEKAFDDADKSKYLEVEKCKEYLNFGGIRIEDDVLVTKDGYENFQESLAKTPEDIEALIAKTKDLFLKK